MASSGDSEGSRSVMEQKEEGARKQKNAKKKNFYHQPISPPFLAPFFCVLYHFDFLLSRRGSNIDTLTASGARLLRFV